jgi:hypothetical protein
VRLHKYTVYVQTARRRGTTSPRPLHLWDGVHHRGTAENTDLLLAEANSTRGSCKRGRAVGHRCCNGLHADESRFGELSHVLDAACFLRVGHSPRTVVAARMRATCRVMLRTSVLLRRLLRGHIGPLVPVWPEVGATASLSPPIDKTHETPM